MTLYIYPGVSDFENGKPNKITHPIRRTESSDPEELDRLIVCMDRIFQNGRRTSSIYFGDVREEFLVPIFRKPVLQINRGEK